MNTHDHNHAGCSHKGSSHHHHSHSNPTSFSAAAHATLHCLTGCIIGEVLGLMIGVHFGFEPWAIITLGTVLAYITGFGLSIFPLMKRTGLGFTRALKAIWLGETISIAVMELVMNAVDYHMGGMRAGSVASWQFWQAVMLAAPAGYLAALPVNAWLIGHQLKKCH